MYKIKVTGHFDAAHQLPGVEICERLHGHTWKVETEVCSNALNANSMVVDFRVIKDTWKKYDHQYLNDFFEMPTAEVLAKTIYSEIVAKIIEPVLVNYVKVYESEDCYAEYSE